ncbi:uncharacterized protein (DUF302 family) [Nakamurella sp. UYEF19]|uniref:DUF302 domain-containing protein n=1 Tax=Nakamurella sp. UYEF19 TaxID=1756392 RepID=UPI003391C7F6
MSYALTTTVPRPFDSVLAQVRSALAGVGFGVLTEIDIQQTLKNKLDVDVPAQIILGACRPSLAYAALQAEPSIGLLLPCNVVVRALGDASTAVEAMDPQVMVGLTGNTGLEAVAAEAGTRLRAALDSLDAAPVTAAH